MIYALIRKNELSGIIEKTAVLHIFSYINF